MWIHAPAKLNLFLHVTGKRADGYHLLQSLFFFVEAGDRLQLQEAKQNMLRITGPFAKDLSVSADNSVLKALHWAQTLYPDLPCYQVTLEKNLPVASGIGGGSADAAALLRALRLDKDSAAFAALGADVPACYDSKTLWVEGIGEKLRPLPSAPPFHVLLANPGVAVQTRDVFAAREGDYTQLMDFTMPQTREDWLALARQTRNDLAEPACAVAPQIKSLLGDASRLPHCLLARMSGSGATCFALFDKAVQAQDAAALLRQSWPQAWIQTAAVI
jgi:4-diphosphocytidyl-2-C-methyl-D-erythritol kinase